MLRFAKARTLDYVFPITVGGKTFNCAMCSNHSSRALGLMGQQLPPGCGCMLAYPSNQEISLWMKDCLHPLCALFFDEEGVLIYKTQMDHKQQNVSHRCPAPACYVLEIHPEEADGIEVGDCIQKDS